MASLGGFEGIVVCVVGLVVVAALVGTGVAVVIRRGRK